MSDRLSPALAYLEHCRARIDNELDHSIRQASVSERLQQAMRYSVLGGGKRIRPALCLAAARAVGSPEDAAVAPACSLELIHAYSLVHDDLPAMDDDDLRRGQPTVHVAFDEATAILAGDALQSLAFAVLADASGCDDAARVAMLRELAVASGAGGMCGGQALDLAATGSGSSTRIEALEHLHALKTGALIRAAVRMGAIAAGAGSDDRLRLDAYADALGLAFQVRDDLLDVEGESATLGKTAGKDIAQDKATFPALIGIEASRARLARLGGAMDEALAPLRARGEALAALGELAIHRSH